MAPQFQAEITDGAERADSWSFNPHKWMGAAFDCCCLWLADRGPLLAAMSIDPEYLRNAATRSGDVIDYRDWHVQLGRRFRALKLWVLLRCTGIAAIAAMVQFHVELARAVETAVISNPTLELAAPRNLSLVCLRHIDGDRETQRLLDAINDGGGLAATHCRLDGALAARIAIGTLRVDRTAVDALIAVLNRC
jgi:aromatic-L-amino-acid decarboxylase